MAASLPHPPARGQDLIHIRAFRHSGGDASRQKIDLPAFIRLWHLASFDAPTVAFVWSACFAWVAGVHADPWGLVLLALVTWTIYVGDRMLDAGSAIGRGDLSGLRERHFFHWRHRRALLPAASATASIAAAIFGARLPAVSRERDSLVAVAALAYFSGVHWRPFSRAVTSRIPKEFLVGSFFAVGCALPVLSQMVLFSTHRNSLVPFLAVIAFFAALAWLNCYAIDRWESPESPPVVARALVIMASGFGLAFLLGGGHPRAAALIGAGAAGALLLAILDRKRERLTPLTLRVAADLVLLTPAFLLLR